IDMDKVTYDLQVDGVKLFADSVTKLLEEIANKKQQLKAGAVGAHEAELGAIEEAVNRSWGSSSRRPWSGGSRRRMPGSGSRTGRSRRKSASGLAGSRWPIGWKNKFRS